jgi:hypothetical protein
VVAIRKPVVWTSRRKLRGFIEHPLNALLLLRELFGRELTLSIFWNAYLNADVFRKVHRMERAENALFVDGFDVMAHASKIPRGHAAKKQNSQWMRLEGARSGPI